MCSSLKSSAYVKINYSKDLPKLIFLYQFNIRFVQEMIQNRPTGFVMYLIMATFTYLKNII